MSDCANCDHLSSLLNFVRIKMQEIKKSNVKIQENTEELVRVIEDLNELVDDLKKSLKRKDSFD
jgi:hypothetical protein